VDWTHRFETFSALHGATIVLLAALWYSLISIGVRVRASAYELPWRRGMAIATLLAWLLANGAQLLPGHFIAAENLPLQLCDITGLLVPFALWSRHRVLLAALYFWGVGFGTQAILTPDLRHGPAHMDYWTFWIPHANVTGAAAYGLIVQRFRPRWRDCGQTYGLSLLYLALILPFDLLTGFNYGYVGPATPSQPTLVDFLGPWPWRVLWMMALAAGAFVLMQLPWSPGARSRPAAIGESARKPHSDA